MFRFKGVTALLCACLAIGFVAAGCGPGLSQAPPPKQTSPAATARQQPAGGPGTAGNQAQAGTGEQASSVAGGIVVCKLMTTFPGLNPAGPPEEARDAALPDRMPAAGVAAWAVPQLDFYNGGGFTFLAPAGWTGTAEVNSNSTGWVRLRNPANPAEYMSVIFDRRSMAFAIDDAYQFFPREIARAAQANQFPLPANDPNAPDYTIVILRPGLAAYSYAKDDLPVNGVASSFYALPNGPTANTSWPYISAEIALPQDEHKLATVILNDFIARSVDTGPDQWNAIMEQTGACAGNQ